MLKEIEICVDDSNHSRMVVVKEAERDYCGTIVYETFLGEHFIVNKQGMYQLLESGDAFDTNSLKSFWENHTLYNSLHRIFVHRLSTEMRLTSSNALNRSSQPEKNPIYKLSKNERLAQKISDYFR